MPEEPNQSTSPANPTPGAQPAAPAPAILSPTNPTAAEPAPPVSQPATDGLPVTPMSSPSPTGKSRKRLLLSIIGGVVLIAVIAAILVLFVFGKHISAQDVTNAQNTTTKIDDDLTSAATTTSDLEDISNANSSMASQVAAIKSKLADAQKQYDVLKDSAVQKDSVVHQKFQAIDKKWQPFITFMQGNATDLQAISPVLTDFGTKAENLSQNPPSTTAAINTYLSQYKVLIDNTRAKVSSLKMSVPENQQIVDAFKTFLQTASAAVGTAQSDLTTGKDGYTIENDLYKVDGAETTFESSVMKVETNISNKQNRLDPTDQFNDFLGALGKLYAKVQ